MVLGVSWMLVAELVGVLELIAHGVAKRRFWGWVAAMCVFGSYIPSLFLPIAALGLWGLLVPGTRSAFGISVAPAQQAAHDAG